MQSGDISAIKRGFNAQGAIYNMNAIVWTTKNKLKNIELISNIKALKNNDISINGRTVGQFATASLDILNIEKYNGNDILIKELIKSNFDF
jgi:hypothetical protein